MIRFMRGLWRLPLWIQIWVGTLGALNLVVPLFFWHQRDARIILTTFLVAAALMFVLTALVGFRRLLGLAHFVWFPLLAYLWTRLGAHPPEQSFGLYVRALILANGASLVMDVADVIRFWRGEREELDSD